MSLSSPMTSTLTSGVQTVGKIFQLVQRICHARDVHDQCTRRWLLCQVLDGVQDRSAPDLDAFHGVEKPAA